MVVTGEKRERFSRKKFLSSRDWSDFQNAVFEFGLNGTGHGFVEAVAGAGKTSVLVGLVSSLPASARISVVAFNKHSVSDLESRMPSSVSVSTAHSYGVSALIRFFGEQFKPNDDKYRNLSRGAIANLIKLHSSQSGLGQEMDLLCHGESSKKPDIKKKSKMMRRSTAAYLEAIIHFAMASLSGLDVESLLILDDHFTIEKDFSLEFAQDYLLPMVADLIERGTQAAIDKRDVSLDELLYLPVKMRLDFPLRDFVLFDEAQDASAGMLALVERMAIGGRLISVADRFQSVQGFAGSDAYSVDRIIEKFKPTQLPLSICYRCPSSHLDLARRLVPSIQNKPGAIEGTIEVIHPDSIISLVESGDLIICRFTAPLVGTCLELIAAGTKARVRGRDIGSQLVALANHADSGAFPDDFVQVLTNYVAPRIAQFRAEDRDAEAQKLEDRFSAVMACFDSFGQDCGSIHNFGDRISKLFCDDEEQPPVTLATIHRAKGDQSDRVWILGSNFLPYIKKAQHDWQIQQELNLTYVALTRAKEALFLVPMGKEVSSFMGHPLGGMNLPEHPEPTAIDVPAIEVKLVATPVKLLDPKAEAERREAIALIEARWDAPINNQISLKNLEALEMEPQELSEFDLQVLQSMLEAMIESKDLTDLELMSLLTPEQKTQLWAVVPTEIKKNIHHLKVSAASENHLVKVA